MAEEKPNFREEKLWKLLDDIDSLSDQIKPVTEKGYKMFYERALELSAKRFDVLKSDGYELSIIE